ncbi:pyridoxal 5'-phosphate synthase [Streptomyces sp. RB6PN25]|uniref:Pyridoxal 5'-phosphate synthase n=1 Tax=Streptomyces humicola TaxID=2953240 RepID=A0ABT1Q4K6_9ACTN|nr:pyridoxal 5'-phosphate synthase [Streptomyces humicola]MCQ4084859.1 pyridoxal 5'-phosphate synthase [Streptomyces humicola]
MDTDAWSERLRRVPALAGPLPGFDTERAPAAPGVLFGQWLTRALDDGVPEPHVMTLSTVDASGRPSARVLLLRGFDPDDCAFVFATDAGSRKGAELAGNPHAALTWYWPLHGRQVRITGAVEALDRRAARRDFLGRSDASRIAGFTGRMSADLASPEEYQEGRARARDVLAADPQAVPEGHTVYRLRADEAEFFQGDTGRFHRRLRYVRDDGGWRRGLLWP